ncbi:hypothetical protein D1007_38911 [Hordeum vulgare]|nr:hypothetical protein D1007_38911 [Hordeum vulgare]
MFQSLERRDSRALGDICGESVSAPLVPDDSEYLGFFCRVMERLEESVGKALAFTEEKRRDLLGEAASDVFSHHLRLDPDFDFASVLDTVLETILSGSRFTWRTWWHGLLQWAVAWAPMKTCPHDPQPCTRDRFLC